MCDDFSNVTYVSSVQFKYRIEAFEKTCAVQGVQGAGVAMDATWHCFVNSKGEANTNIPGDLKVNLSYCPKMWGPWTFQIWKTYFNIPRK